jgi:hypothetical protein
VLILFGGIIFDYSENYTEPINIFCLKTAELINVKASGGPSNSRHLEEFYLLGYNFL